jgi:cysteine desulfurase family protein
MSAQQRIYLDQAATSWPKPEAVYQAVDEYQRQVGVAAGRGTYRQATEIGQRIEKTRQRVAELLGAKRSEQVVFAFNCTDALNLALHGTLQAGDRVITTDAEHNSVLRPLAHLAATKPIEVEFVGCDTQGQIDLGQLKDKLKRPARMVAAVHASNVTGTVQPIDEISAMAHRAGAMVLIDAAQSLGHWPLDVTDSQIDLLAAPGHKGLLGPLGTGILYLAEGIAERVDSVRQGGTGTLSQFDRQPDSLPDKYEAGNLNVPGLLGLEAGVRFVQERGVAALQQHGAELLSQLVEGLRNVSGLTLYGPQSPQRQVPVVSLNIDGYDPQELAALLDAHYGIQARSGLHCAPRMHLALGTLERGGTLRLSLGPFTTPAEIAATCEALREIAISSG